MFVQAINNNRRAHHARESSFGRLDVQAMVEVTVALPCLGFVAASAIDKQTRKFSHQGERGREPLWRQWPSAIFTGVLSLLTT